MGETIILSDWETSSSPACPVSTGEKGCIKHYAQTTDQRTTHRAKGIRIVSLRKTCEYPAKLTIAYIRHVSVHFLPTPSIPLSPSDTSTASTPSPRFRCAVTPPFIIEEEYYPSGLPLTIDVLIVTKIASCFTAGIASSPFLQSFR